MDVEKALQALKDKLAQQGVPFARIGALAMRHYGYLRHTEDIDILMAPEGLRKLHEKAVGLGIVPRGPGLRKSLRDSTNRVGIDVIQSGELAGSDQSPLVYPDPRSDAFVEHEELRLPRLETLVDFKLASGSWGRRLRDLADVIQLIRTHRLDEAFATRLKPPLRSTYREHLEQSRGEINQGG